ncbi:coiled-coil domain-containing protein 153 [Melanotaenia boesemani]|uniref:coiled-coil domain-containing protein 153 n=1 Tax=Melanotaenia boesemani TaxID=1250792 RepID=UPI001C046E74|nr:coiled-coil domain-containing protein 153 [Melanotaenia boesemani]
MPPKKKIRKTKNKIQIKSKNDLEERYRESIQDIAILQDHIGIQCDTERRLRSDRTDLRRRIWDMEQTLQSERQDHKDISSDLIRQYKTTQSELTKKVERLEMEVNQLKKELVLCQEELNKGKKEHKQVEQEKDAIIEALKHKLDNMETDYEKLLYETLHSLSSQLAVAQREWVDKETIFNENYKELLSEFGLNTLDI